MGRKEILFGVGILVILLALAGTGSAKSGYSGVDCDFCHITYTQPVQLTDSGVFFKDNHRFDGNTVPSTTTSCIKCHTNLPTVFLPLTGAGQNYSDNHRYNDTTLAAARFLPPACGNCHVGAAAGDFAFLTDTPAYLRSTFCENCHRLKYDDWLGTMHRVMLTNNSTAQAMGLPAPDGLSWENMSYVIVGKAELRYLNESGYLFKRYFAGNQTFEDVIPRQYTCGNCHTTGYDASGGNQSGLPGISGTWSEPGIACEKCHGPAGNGHQVEANVSEQVCLQCHNGSTRQGPFLSSEHSPPLKAPVSCLRCHSPFDYARNRTVTGATAVNVVCANCHNPHNISDDKYRELFSPAGFDQTAYADLKDAKNSLFNSSASRLLFTGGPTGTLTAGKDVYDILTTPALIPSDIIDESYPGPITVTGPISEVLCSNCHYNHGLAHVGEVNLTHSRLFGPSEGITNATCIDCHMAAAGSLRDHSFDVRNEMNFPGKTCSRGTQCHVTSDQNLNQSGFSVVPVVTEWRASGHNNAEFAENINNSSGCAKCHSPINWDPQDASATIAPEDYKGVTCAICHNLHDMGDWLKKTDQAFGKLIPYAWYKRDALPRPFGFRANYTMEATTTGLCTNCHQNRPDTSVPALTGGRGPHGIVVPHISAQKEMFIGSFKESGQNFECADCHMYINKIDPTNTTEQVLPDSQKATGHTFRVDEKGLQFNGIANNISTACSSCHIDGSQPGNISTRIEIVQMQIMSKWNSTNDTVENAWNTYDSFTGEKNLSGSLLAEAFFKLYEVKNDRSWGVHNPQKADDLLNASMTLANDSLSALGLTEAGKPNITDFTPVTPTVMNNVNDSRTFSININQTVNVTWSINGTEVFNETGVTSSSYINNSAAIGTWNVSAVAQNANGIAMQSWIWEVVPAVTPGAPNIISFLPPTATVNNHVLEKRTFMVAADQAVNVSWQINSTEVFNESDVTTSSYMNSSSAQGTWNVTAIVSNNNGTDTHTWDWVVRPLVVNIEIKNTAYNPANITILNGTTVVWTNNDPEAHTVTSDTGVFDSGIINTGGTFEWKFTDVGTFRYHCTIHPGMIGEVNVISAPLPTQPQMEETGIALELIAENLTAPIGLISPEDGTGRLFVVDQTGAIRILTAGGQILEEPFLDLSSRLVNLRPQFDERGLLGLAFHPNFTQNGRFFVYYSAPLRPGAPSDFDHTSTISEFTVSQDDPNKANRSSEKVLLQVDEPQFNHNAGQIAFGPDGYLYIPLGDGGGANDVGTGHPPPGNGQNISTLPGKILRIDVNNGDPYGIPQDNPFTGEDGLDEIFAYGFRNPFRISFDAGGEHSLFAGDAGQNAWEEVNIVTRGGNYGWNLREGAHCFDPGNPNLAQESCPDTDIMGKPLIDPVIEYANAGQPGGIGTAVIGGFVYRGNALPQFNGAYIFGDFSKGFVEGNGSLFIARPPSPGDSMWSIKELRVAANNSSRIGAFVRSFGQDAEREIYVLTSQAVGPTGNTGKIFKIIPVNLSRSYTANLSGSEAVPEIITPAKGNATFELSDDGTRLSYRLMVESIENVTQAHIHLAPAGTNGQVVAWLYPDVPPAVLIPGRFDGLLAEGNVTAVNLTGPLAGQPLNVLLEEMMKENTYVNVHTIQYPGGEIRGQIKPAPAPTQVFSISGYKINDIDGNGSWDAGEPGLPGWQIILTCPGCTAEMANATTDETGFYRFTHLENGSYTLIEELQAGWMNTSTASREITVDGMNITNQNFTNKMIVSPVTSFELTSDVTAEQKGGIINITIKAVNNSLIQTLFEGEANITIIANNAGAVDIPVNVSFVEGMATLPVTSSVSQHVTVTATNGSITGSTKIVFADRVFDLVKGWNLISIPSFADPSDVDQALQNVQNNGVVGFDPETKLFSTPTDLQPLFGYWINVTADNQRIGFIANVNVTRDPPVRNIFEGWNLIGVSAGQGDTLTNPFTGEILGPRNMLPDEIFDDLKYGPDHTQWHYSKLIAYNASQRTTTTYLTGKDPQDPNALTDNTPPMVQGLGYWLFIKDIPNKIENNVPWSGKPWL